MEKTVIVTGVAGFVGTNFSQHLLHRGFNVLGIDVGDVSSRLKTSGVLEHANMTFMQVNLADNRPHVEGHEAIAAIYHFAALPHVDYSYFHPRQAIENNIKSLLTSIELAIALRVPLILSSSVECYGGSVDKVYDEADSPAPLSTYAASKVASEAIVKTYIETQGLQATMLRFTNLYGPWQAPDRLVPRIIAQALYDKDAVVEKGTNRDFIFIKDACALLEEVMTFDHTGALYNLSSGTRTDNFEAVQLIAEQLPELRLTVREPRHNDGRGKYLIPSPKKLYATTNWRPTTTLQEGIVATIDWYRTHQTWLDQFLPAIEAERTTDAFLTDASYWAKHDTAPRLG
ncbi:MAG TPA: GDP-mannose 4,6-dehydratase [Candidatus Saccharimonadales bacterium]|nr:GDP-mannose 4,6-dehydratase [Candidatus Saccharimonadales bacterium]